MNLKVGQYKFDPKTLARETEDAYSFRSFNSWVAAVRVLAKRGFNSWEAEAILRSKVMRRASDNRPTNAPTATSIDLVRYLDSSDITPHSKYVNKLVMSAFGKEFDLELDEHGVPCRRGTMPGNYHPDKTILVPLGTPLCLDSTSETYWSM